MAVEPNERAALANRYQSALQQAVAEGSRTEVQEFEKLISTRSRLVTACGLEKISTLAERKGNVFTIYRNLVAAHMRFPGDDLNNTDRIPAEDATFPGFSQRINFAALTIDDSGLANYGNYFLFWRLDMVCHRMSLLEGNCLTLRKNLGIPLDGPLPEGSRAVWEERSKLAVAKCAARLFQGMTHEDFARLLLFVGASSNDDDFIEAHIWGPLSSESLANVIRVAPDPDPIPNDEEDRAYFEAMRKRMVKNLSALGIGYEVSA